MKCVLPVLLKLVSSNLYIGNFGILMSYNFLQQENEKSSIKNEVFIYN